MDFGTLLGLVGCFGIIIYSIVSEGGSLTLYLNPHPIVIVMGGSAMVSMMKFGIKPFLAGFKIAGRAFIYKKYLPDEIIQEAVVIAEAARKGGLISLQEIQVKDPFLKKGVQLLVDGFDIAVIKKMLTKEMNLTVERHMQGQKIFKSIAEAGPAMGMIGTLLGLVMMMSNMNDPKTIGPSMAIALLATLYGAVLANMIAIPIADKLELRSHEERISKSLVIDAVLGIHQGQNPRIIEEALKNYLPRSKRGAETDVAA